MPIPKTPAKKITFPDKLWLNILFLTKRLYPNTKLRNPQSTLESGKPVSQGITKWCGELLARNSMAEVCETVG